MDITLKISRDSAFLKEGEEISVVKNLGSKDEEELVHFKIPKVGGKVLHMGSILIEDKEVL